LDTDLGLWYVICSFLPPISDVYKLFSPLQELPALGRNTVYVISYVLFVILSVPTALVDNFAGLIVLRFITGFLGSPCLATGAASMGDMYDMMHLPFAIIGWTASAFAGPALGPLISGFAVPAENWRWALWPILWLNGPVCLAMIFFLPETLGANILYRRARRLRKSTGNDKLRSQSEIDQKNMSVGSVVKNQLIKPFEITFKDPSVFFINLYTACVYGVYYRYVVKIQILRLN
jgi:MFS transporter, DHA1 family, multidrug resistance protein